MAFYNDSKARTSKCSLKAIEAFPVLYFVILGGKDKGSPYTPLRDPLREHRAACGLELAPQPKKSRRILATPWTFFARDVGTRRGIRDEERGPSRCPALAPACSGSNQFENYEHRGRAFKQLVAKLESQSAAGASARKDEYAA